MTELTAEQRGRLRRHTVHHERAATFGVSNVIATAIVAFRWPQHFWLWHLCKTLVLIPWRFVRFRRIRKTLYLLDWCYVVTHLTNAGALLALARVTFGYETRIAAYNSALVRAGFAMATGPLAWSVFIFRNSLVFHDVDNITSVFIHFSPMALFWCLRWGAGLGPSAVENAWPALFRVCAAAELRAADACVASLRGALWCDACPAAPADFVVAPALVYICLWAVPYFLVCFVLLRRWAAEGKHEMLYDYFAKVQPGLVVTFRRVFGALVGPELAPRLGYLVLHFASVISVGLAAWVFWHSFILHTAFCVFITGVAVHNGSRYTFRYFVHRYVPNMLALHPHVLGK